jgi:hypothetical protein
MVLEDYLLAVDQASARLATLEAQLKELAEQEPYRERIGWAAVLPRYRHLNRRWRGRRVARLRALPEAAAAHGLPRVGAQRILEWGGRRNGSGPSCSHAARRRGIVAAERTRNRVFGAGGMAAVHGGGGWPALAIIVFFNIRVYYMSRCSTAWVGHRRPKTLRPEELL